VPPAHRGPLRLDGRSRLDAEIVVGGRLGPAEAVVMRMYGRLALHAESVVMPLLAPDVPVVTWWHEDPPRHDRQRLPGRRGRPADHRLRAGRRPGGASSRRAADYAPGDTDLTWTRITLWRTWWPARFDTTEERVTGATIVPEDRPTAALMQGWLRSRWASCRCGAHRPGAADALGAA
jgi:glucose-6-phosphate dehydrogenase assembly protein OpcA